MQYLAVCANWDNDVRGRISEWDIGGVVVVMGDSRRHKDISHASPNGGWVVEYHCFPTVLNARRSLERVTTILGSRRLREAHAADRGTRGSLQACVEGTLAG